MRSFRFAYESLLTYRRHRRDLCRLVLAHALEEEARWLREHERLRQMRQDLLAELRSGCRAGSVDVDRIAARRYHAGQLHAQLAGAAQRRRLIAGQLELLRGSLLEAHRGVKVLEKLRERRHAEFSAKQSRSEMQAMEDAWRSARAGEAAR